MTLATAWFRPAPLLETVWIGPSGELVALLAQGTPVPDVPVVIGPRGPQGVQGIDGPQGPPADDPGDLTIYLQNGLT